MATLKRIYVGLQTFLVPVLYRLHFFLAHSRQRIAWVTREKLKLVRSHDYLLSSRWLKRTAGTAAEIESQTFHLCNISAYSTDGESLFYCGKLINWVTGLSVFRPGAFPSAHIIFEPDSVENPIGHLEIAVAAPYDSSFVEDIRIFNSFGCFWGTGSVRNLEKGRIRPVVIQFESTGKALRPARVVVLDENSLEKKLHLHRHEKNWTPVPFSPDEIHFIQDHANGNIVSLNTRTLRAEVLQPKVIRTAIETPRAGSGWSSLRIPGCPIRISRANTDFLLTLGYIKYEGPVNRGILIRSRYYKTFAVLMAADPPYNIVRCSKPIYFDIFPNSYVFPFQLIEIPSRKDELLLSLYIGGNYNEILKIKKNTLLNALPDDDSCHPV